MISTLILFGTLALAAPASHAPAATAPDPDPAAIAAGPTVDGSFFWGMSVHEMAGRAAATGLPGQLPAFFRDAVNRLAYLNPEPDRWRNGDLVAMDRAYSLDHYIDLENVPAEARLLEDRHSYLTWLARNTELENPQVATGFLPFRILELYQRLRTQFALWHNAGPGEQAAIEARVLNDAGILGHYVTDGAQPHHTTIHFNGWDEDRVPNPEGYTTSNDIHWRFESAFTGNHVTLDELLPRIGETPGRLDDPREAIWDFLYAANDEVETLYRIERDLGFDPDAEPHPEAEAFATERLVAGIEMLRDLWWTAYLDGRADSAEMDDSGDR